MILFANKKIRIAIVALGILFLGLLLYFGFFSNTSDLFQGGRFGGSGSGGRW